jgi:LemA protein
MELFLIGTVTAVVAVAGWVIITTNRFKILIVKVNESDSGIDVALTKRYDTLTKMVDTVRAYAKHESELFAHIVNLRTGMSTAEKIEANRCMDEIMKELNITVENYPELRSTENYMKLKAAITDAEDHLQAARRVFNMNISAYNQAVVVFPASIIASSLNYMKKDFFEADAAKRADVKMDL